MRPVRACTSTELSAFWSPEWSFSTALFGGVSSGTLLAPRICSWLYDPFGSPAVFCPSCFPVLQHLWLLLLVPLLYWFPYPLFHPLLSCRSWGVSSSSSKLHSDCCASITDLSGQTGHFKSCLEACYSPISPEVEWGHVRFCFQLSDRDCRECT